MNRTIATASAGILLSAAGWWNLQAHQGKTGTTPMDGLAERYVKTVLELGQHDKDYVDAYYGPTEWKRDADASKADLDTIAAQGRDVRAELSKLAAGTDELSRLRHQYLDRQLASLDARIRIVKGERLSFDEESKALYDAVAPTHPASHFQKILDTLDTRFPGQGTLAARYDAWRRPFVIPREKLDPVFQTAIAACRERTLKHVTLPANERFTVEYVTNKSWSGYNWYQGDYRSLIQVNTDLPIYIDRAIDLACHEGYPGHHVYNALLEKHLVRDRGWMEFTVYPLFSPQSLIAEGTANYGIEVAFPGRERVDFERPIAKFQAVQHNLARLAGEVAAAMAAAGSAADAIANALGGGTAGTCVGSFDDAVLLEVAAAKIRVGEAAGEGAGIAHQVLGAIGFTREHVLHRFTQRLWAWRDDFDNESAWAVRLGALVAAGGGEGLWPLLASR